MVFWSHKLLEKKMIASHGIQVGDLEFESRETPSFS